MEKARRDTSVTKMNYAATPKFSSTRPTGLIRPAVSQVGRIGLAKFRREPAPPNDNNVFGKTAEISKVLFYDHTSDYCKGDNTLQNSFFNALRK